jgi:WD40 repeat protein
MLFDRDLEDQSHPIQGTTQEYIYRPAPAGSKINPRAYYKISRKSITDVAFSPDFQNVAVTSMDGSMTILNYNDGMYECFKIAVPNSINPSLVDF